ncbi:hypothetical protein Tco_1065878 [Tanacetum coccineum]
MKVDSIRHIQGVGTTLDIFQNIHLLFLEYGVLSISGYGVLSFILLWSLVLAFQGLHCHWLGSMGMDIGQKDENKPKKDKTGHENERA